jgi:hypothetical protein
MSYEQEGAVGQRAEQGHKPPMGPATIKRKTVSQQLNKSVSPVQTPFRGSRVLVLGCDNDLLGMHLLWYNKKKPEAVCRYRH